MGWGVRVEWVMGSPSEGPHAPQVSACAPQCPQPHPGDMGCSSHVPGAPKSSDDGAGGQKEAVQRPPQTHWHQ